MTTVPPAPQAQGYGKALVAGIVQPFAGAVAALVVAIVQSHIGHPLGDGLSGALTTVVEFPIVTAAIILTPHDILSRFS